MDGEKLRRQYGSDSLDFKFFDRGWKVEGWGWATGVFPDYEAARNPYRTVQRARGGIGNRTGWTDSVTFCSVLLDCVVHLLSFVAAKNTAECRLWMGNADGERWVVGMATVKLSNLPVWLWYS